jgi:hypothetical protein
MKNSMTAVALILVASAAGVQAQATSSSRIPIRKDAQTTTTSGTANGTIDTTMPTDMTNWQWGWYTPTTSSNCSSVDVDAARTVSIKSDLYQSGSMISPDSAKFIALCAVPGQIGSGEMNVANGVTEYAIDIIPNHKKTHTKVIVDAQTGAVLSSKQFGGLRGLTGWVRESAEHKTNKAKAAKDTMP